MVYIMGLTVPPGDGVADAGDGAHGGGLEGDDALTGHRAVACHLFLFQSHRHADDDRADRTLSVEEHEMTLERLDKIFLVGIELF